MMAKIQMKVYQQNILQNGILQTDIFRTVALLHVHELFLCYSVKTFYVLLKTCSESSHMYTDFRMAVSSSKSLIYTVVYLPPIVIITRQPDTHRAICKSQCPPIRT